MSIRTAEQVSAELLLKYGAHLRRDESRELLKAVIELAFSEGVVVGGERTAQAALASFDRSIAKVHS